LLAWVEAGDLGGLLEFAPAPISGAVL